MISAGKFAVIRDVLRSMLIDSPVVDVGEWQAVVGDTPFAHTIEAEDVSFKWSIPKTVEELQEAVKPNLPWAEEHFQERISGIPHNPPPSHVRWPFAQRSNEQHTDADERFSHTYPERIWPKYAGGSVYPRDGIRYPLGDLGDVINLLQTRPGTRRAFLPIWFPEDTGAVQNQRVPCTLGYHFMVRDGKLKIVYYIRSCDFFRHFADDVYMAARLCQYVAEATSSEPGNLVMHISSLHIFEAERTRLESWI